MKWLAKASCVQRAACRDCRTSRPFRESLLKAGLVDSANFACPYGYAADNLPAPSLGDLVAKMTSAVGIKPCGGCKGRIAKWNRVGRVVVETVKKLFT